MGSHLKGNKWLDFKPERGNGLDKIDSEAL